MTDTVMTKDERIRRLRARMNASAADYPEDQRARRPSLGENVQLTSAAEHTGAMIALIPAAVDQERLTVDGGEPTEELHVTLGYLGEAALIPAEVQHRIVQAVAQCAARQVSIVGNAFAVAMFNPETDGALAAAFNPGQPRDGLGRWTTGGRGVSTAPKKPSFDSQKLALHYYTGAGFRKLNRALRAGDDLSTVPSRPVFLEHNGKFVDVEVTAQDAVQNLDAAIADSRLPTTKTFYRGSPATPPAVGSVVVDNGYLSTSREERWALGFTGDDGAVWEIQAPAGAAALDINEGPNKHEKETVFPRGSSLRVDRVVTDEHGKVRVFASLVQDADALTAAGGKEPCVVLLVSGQQLAPFQQYVMNDVAMAFAAAGMEMHPQHSPWVAHLTLAYTADADLSYFTDRVGPVTFDKIRVAFGGTVVDLPLSGGPGLSVEEG